MTIERTIKEVQQKALEDGSLPLKWPNVSNLSGPKLAELSQAIRSRDLALAKDILAKFLKGGDQIEASKVDTKHTGSTDNS